MITKIESVSSPQNTERGTSGEQIFLITQSLKGAMIVDPIVFTRRICQAQEELLLLMTPSYEAFLESSNFEEYETSMKDQERKTYDQKHVSTRNMTNSSSQTRKSTSSNSITVLSQSAILKQTDIP